MKKFILTASIMLLADVALACTPIRPLQPTNETVQKLNSKPSSIIASSNKHYFLKLVPSKWAVEKGRLIKKQDAYGLAFEAMPYGQVKQLWSFKHWDKIKGDLYLSDNGLNLVAINTSMKSNREKDAIVTYHKGKAGKAYSAYDLGVNVPVVKSTCGNGSWVIPRLTKGLDIYTVNNIRWSVSPDSLSVVRK